MKLSADVRRKVFIIVRKLGALAPDVKIFSRVGHPESPNSCANGKKVVFVLVRAFCSLALSRPRGLVEE
jgi:hypothetical protein